MSGILKKIYKVSFCFLSVFILIFSMCPISFAAPDTYYHIPSSKPTVTDYSGYAELLYQHPSGGNFVVVISWFYTPYVDTSVSSVNTSDRPTFTIVRNSTQFRLGYSNQNGCYGNIAFVVTDSTGKFNFGRADVPDDEAVRYYNFSLGDEYKLIGMHYYGDFSFINIADGLPDEEFYVTYAEDSVICYGLAQVISGIYSLIDVLDDDLYSSTLDEILSSLNNFSGSFDEFKIFYNNQMRSLFDLMNDVLTDLDTLIQTTDYIYSCVDNLYNLLLQFEVYIFDIWIEQFNHTYEFQAMNQKLDRIIELLTSQGDSEFTDPDTSNLDGYYDTENSLLDDSNVDPSQVLNVDLNQHALSAIWNLVDRFLNVNPKIIGAVITILALGILALILGR